MALRTYGFKLDAVNQKRKKANFVTKLNSNNSFSVMDYVGQFACL